MIIARCSLLRQAFGGQVAKDRAPDRGRFMKNDVLGVRIIFETHATSSDNEAGLASGHFDVALSEKGKQQAEELGKRYADEHPDAIFCSDLQRSYKTAEIAFRDQDIPVIRDSRLRECDYGDFYRVAREKVHAERLKRIFEPFPGGESYQEAADRMKSFLQDLLRDFPGKSVMLIGHRATHYSLEHLIKKIPLKDVIAAWVWQPGWNYYLEKL